jgi:hypothetical protein
MARKKKSKNKGVKYWKNKVWKDVFSPYIRLRSALDTTGTKTHLICCTCGVKYPAFGLNCAQAGHFIPGRHNAILFEEKGVHGQCYNCNHTLKGNWPEYMRFMLNKYGREVVDDLLRLDKTVRKFSVPELEDMYCEYEQKLKELKGK